MKEIAGIVEQEAQLIQDTLHVRQGDADHKIYSFIQDSTYIIAPSNMDPTHASLPAHDISVGIYLQLHPIIRDTIISILYESTDPIAIYVWLIRVYNPKYSLDRVKAALPKAYDVLPDLRMAVLRLADIVKGWTIDKSLLRSVAHHNSLDLHAHEDC